MRLGKQVCTPEWRREGKGQGNSRKGKTEQAQGVWPLFQETRVRPSARRGSRMQAEEQEHVCPASCPRRLRCTSKEWCQWAETLESSHT